MNWTWTQAAVGWCVLFVLFEAFVWRNALDALRRRIKRLEERP